MEFNEKSLQILEYLDKNYFIKDKRFIYKVNKEQLVLAWGQRQLKASWSLEMSQELQLNSLVDSGKELIALLSEEITNEIDAQILKDLNGSLNYNDFLSVVKCVGYEIGPTVYDTNTFTPINHFVSMKYNEIENERQNNTYWQDWVRCREQNEET